MISCLVFLDACAVGTDYVAPKETPNNYWDALGNDMQPPGITPGKTGALPSGPWWDQFGDKKLSELVDKALADNNDVKIARSRIAEARADERYAGAQLLPQINATAGISRSSLDSLYSSKPDTLREAGVRTDWDIDPFGGNRRQSEATQANVQASEEDLAQVRLNLLAEVVRNYSHVRASHELSQLTLHNLDTQRDTLRITRALRKAQNVTELDVSRVEAQIASTEARLPQIRTDLRAAVHRLGVLTGQQPSALTQLLMEQKPMLAIPENIAVSSPVDTIARRPDIRAAERRLAQASALSNAAFAGLFPKLSLGAFFGERRSDFFGGLSPWSATASAMLPLLDFGRIRAQMHGADARQEQAFYGYQQTVLRALEETENSLDAYIDEKQRGELLHHVAVEQARAVDIARGQYKGGIVTQLDLLDAERNLLDAQSAWVLSLQTQVDNMIQLYHALGLGPPQ